MDAKVTLPTLHINGLPAGVDRIIMDAGVERLHLRYLGVESSLLDDCTLPSSTLQQLISQRWFPGTAGAPGKIPATYITGKLAGVVREMLGHGEIIEPAAALWSAARNLVRREVNRQISSLAVIDLSASGYLIVGVDAEGGLKDGLLTVNPRCGAGTGANIDRVLQKLDIRRDEVDKLLADYLGEAGKQARARLNIRADRCGVFSSSATISDKNQGIPLNFALAVTLKSEVMKPCKKLSAGFDRVYLTGGVFSWQYARDCAEDYLRSIGVGKVVYDENQSILIDGVQNLVEDIGDGNFLQPEHKLRKMKKLVELPSFRPLRLNSIKKNLYLRLADTRPGKWTPAEMEARPVIIGLDAGSTMAKLVIADTRTEETLFLDCYSNHGDTIETIKHIFRSLQSLGIKQLHITHIGITGSARYQVREALEAIFPQLQSRLSVLVENYAHARGSIELARKHIRHLKSLGVEDINEDFFILVDIGGEDTKLSTVSLRKGELFDNAMNVKCSAGTGSLMDSLCSLFGIGNVAEASQRAFDADRAFAINATCAVFLIENARKLLIQGLTEDEILASCSWAIVENMAGTLWSQVNLPKNAVVLLHGQTMLSEPLPLAVTHRLREFTGSSSYGLVPPHPGHRACLGLINTLAEKGTEGAEVCILGDFINRGFKKRIVQCRGAACGDKAARCNRTMLSAADSGGKRVKFTLGGCTAVNEFVALKKAGVAVHSGQDSYKEIWTHINERLPHSEDPRRLILPRSFSVSEWAYFFGRVFQRLGLPVHADNVCENDLIEAQPMFATDTCAPQVGAVGQYQRLANEPHGIILVPQIEYLPTGGASLGRTCTINQGGGLVAKNLAETAHPDARFQLFTVNLARLDSRAIAFQMYKQLGSVFEYYGIKPALNEFRSAVEHALNDHRVLRTELQDLAADIIGTALQEGRQVGIVVGREYVLNPGIYDSHVGRLLRDKRVVALPSYILDVGLDPEYSHIYWRNLHAIVSVLRAVAEKNLHTVLGHRRLRALFRQIETDPSAKLLPIVQVSTFRCGPDSVTAPLVAQIMKKRPFLLIQSDAIIKELAHLENRMNTYAKQLDLGLHGQHLGADSKPFEIRILDGFTNTKALDRTRDVIYFPTLADNRVITAAIRAGGFTCIDNYHDDTYSLVELVKKGRRITGDSVCAPLAAVYGDILGAVEDFTRRRETGDPLVAGKRRVLVFTNKGTGPCRQGQYAEVQKLFAYQTFGPPDERGNEEGLPDPPRDPVLQLLVGKEGEAYDIGLDEWTVVRAFQGVILQGVLHALFFNGGTRCHDYDEYRLFVESFRRLKQNIYRIIEQKPAPGPNYQRLLQTFGNYKILGAFIKYLAYRVNDRDLHRALRGFSRRWIRTQRDYPADVKRIYLDGEAYMRTSQAEDIFERLLATLGFGRFRLEYSPIWQYLAYLLEQEKLLHKEKLLSATGQMPDCSQKEQRNLTQFIDKSKDSLAKVRKLQFLQREVLARPLYRAAGIAMPDSMPSILHSARQMMPTLRPIGELGPYIGEMLGKLREGYDLCLNVAPEGCMVSSMGATLTPTILNAGTTSNGRIQNLFSADGDVDEELLTLAVLKALGPDGFYRRT